APFAVRLADGSLGDAVAPELAKPFVDGFARSHGFDAGDTEFDHFFRPIVIAFVDVHFGSPVSVMPWIIPWHLQGRTDLWCIQAIFDVFFLDLSIWSRTVAQVTFRVVVLSLRSCR